MLKLLFVQTLLGHSKDLHAPTISVTVKVPLADIVMFTLGDMQS